jgi:RNA polymerase sigma-70 factor, ECF subfamily
MLSRKNSEAELIAAVLLGETQLYRELLRPYERSLYRTALSCTKNAADAEDVVQEAVTRGFRKLSTFRAESRFGTWLTSIVLNEARCRLRRNCRVSMEPLDNPELVPAAPSCDWAESPLNRLERKEVHEQIEQELGVLPEKYREVFLLRHKEDLNVAEVANILGISPSCVKTRLHRAIQMLQKRLSLTIPTWYRSDSQAMRRSLLCDSARCRTVPCKGDQPICRVCVQSGAQEHLTG